MVAHLKILLDTRMDPLYEAVIEATEEAILNALCMARDMDGVNGNFCPALPVQEVKDWFEKVGPVLAKVRRAKPVQAPVKPRTPPPRPSDTRGAEGMPLPVRTPETTAGEVKGSESEAREDGEPKK
jgi:D-aminopeptidase